MSRLRGCKRRNETLLLHHTVERVQLGRPWIVLRYGCRESDRNHYTRKLYYSISPCEYHPIKLRLSYHVQGEDQPSETEQQRDASWHQLIEPFRLFDAEVFSHFPVYNHASGTCAVESRFIITRNARDNASFHFLICRKGD